MRDLTVADIHTYYVVAGDTPVLVHNCGTTDMYRTSPHERGASELDNGLNPDHFPGSSGNNPDGSAHFGNELTANEWAQNHGDTHGVGFKVHVPNDWLNGHVSAGRIDVYEGLTEGHLEYIIPRDLFDELNQFERLPWSGVRK